jgi:RNA polymerase sigma-70 factor, ECF subfamily
VKDWGSEGSGFRLHSPGLAVLSVSLPEPARLPASPPPSGVAYDFAQVFEEHVARVWRALRAMGVAPHLVEDAAQDVFLVVHEKLASFEGRSKLSTWIYAITYRVAANYRAKSRRTPHLQGLDGKEPSRHRTPEQELAAKESARFIEGFCASLDEGMRDVFVLCLLEEQPAVEVAELLGLSPNTIYSRIRLVRQAFRQAIAHNQELEEKPL